MRAKQIIILIIFVVVIAVAGVFFYRAFGVSSNSQSSNRITATSAILPYGTKLDFSKVEKFNPNSQTFSYPTVTPDQTGTDLNNMISH